MADVVVNIKGDNDDLGRALTDSEKKLQKFSKKSESGSAGLKKFGANASNAASRLGALASKFAGGLGIGAAVAGVKLFGTTVDSIMNRARQQAALTQTAFESAFSSTVGFDINQDSFKITSRDQAVQLGRDAQGQLNEVRRQLESSFSRFQGIDIVSDGIEKSLTALSLIGIGEDQLITLRALKEQESVLESQVNKYQLIEQSLTASNKLSNSLTNKGFTPDDGLTASQRAKEAFASRPASVSGIGGFREQLGLLNTPKLSGLVDQNSPQALAKSLPDPARVKESSDAFDEFALSLLTAQRAADAGVIPALQGIQEQSGLMRQQLITMLEQGVSPTNAGFQEMLQNMQGLDAQAASMNSNVSAGAVAFKVIGEVGAAALTGMILKFEEANSAAARLRNGLRSVLGQFVQIGLKAGITLGVSALTGGSLSFGAALASTVGLATGASGTSGVGRTDSLSLSGASTALSSGTQRLEVVPAVLPSGDILVGLREANNNRSGRGGRIDI